MKKNLVILGATLLVGASLKAEESSPVARLAHVKAESPTFGQSLLERFAYSPKYSREKLKALMDEIMKLEITDADFFGEQKDGQWIKPPMLDYSYSNSVLHDVEAAAKTGDYKKAADALLEYFKSRPENQSVKKPSKKHPNPFEAVDAQSAARRLGQIDAAGGADLFQQDGVTARECVEQLKTVIRLGMQFSNGYAVNETLNGRGGNFIPCSHDIMMRVASAWPELSASKGWVMQSFNYLIPNLEYIIYGDGSYREHTFGYPRLVLPWLLNIRDAYLDHKLSVPEIYDEQVQRFTRYLMFCALPNGQGVEWGEGHMGDSRPNLAYAANYFNDPELIWWSTKGQKGRPPVATDVHYPMSKICVFRSSWQEDANFLFFAPRTGGSHYQSDQNMIELFAFGRRFLRDTGMCTYSSADPSFDWIRHMSRSQNTVEVDEKGFPRFKKSEEETGPCGLMAHSSPKAGFAQGWGGGYPTVRHERDVFFIRDTGLCVVRDSMKPTDNEIHTYDQCWHFDPSNTYESDAATGRVWTTNEDAPNLDMLLVVPEKPELLLRKGWSMFPRTETVHPSFRQKTAGDAEFVTVLRPTPAGAASREIKAEPLKADKAGSYALRITTSEGTGVLIIARGSGEAEAGEVKTDADCAYVQFDAKGDVAWAVRQGGSSLTVQGKDVACEAMQGVTPPGLPGNKVSTKRRTK